MQHVPQANADLEAHSRRRRHANQHECPRASGGAVLDAVLVVEVAARYPEGRLT